jgi:hypothetical protein
VVSEVVALLGATGQEARVQTLIRDATRIAEQIARRKLYFRTYEEVLEGGDDRLYLQARPVSDVISVAPDGGGLPIDEARYEIWAEEGFLYRVRWPRGAWRVRYRGGYWLPSMSGDKPATAADVGQEGRHIRKAVEDIVVLSFQMDGVDRTIKSERAGGRASVSTEYETGIWCPEGAEAVLKRLAPIVA